MAKKKQEEVTPKRYHTYCHECRHSYDADKRKFTCNKCLGTMLTIRDHKEATSGYYVDGVRK